MDLTSAIEAELKRLDCLYSKRNPGGIVVKALSNGWVWLYDTESAFGPAEEVLDALRSVKYDREAVVGYDEPVVCHDPACYGGELPTEADLHYHGGMPIKACEDNTGWELAWYVLGDFSDKPPEDFRDKVMDGV